jgi:hypothetical protein
MKTIYRLDRLWSDDKQADDSGAETAEVPDETNVDVMNSIHYVAVGYDQEAYDQAVQSIARVEAINYLQSTDYIPTQWRDEDELGIPHNRTEDEYRSILEQRQQAREVLRSASV